MIYICVMNNARERERERERERGGSVNVFDALPSSHMPYVLIVREQNKIDFVSTNFFMLNSVKPYA